MKRGFTLIEVVLVIGLLAIMSGLTLAGYAKYNQKQKAVTAAARIKQVFKEAKSDAAAHKIDCEVCGGIDKTCDGNNDTPLTGWNVTITSPTSYRIRGICGAAAIFFMSRSEVFEGVTISTVGSNNVTFKPGGQGTNLPVASMSVTVRQSNGTNPQTFTIFRSGEIQ
jgi:prepilin-type N-terminal cleavage/methylation domain-containing protein